MVPGLPPTLSIRCYIQPVPNVLSHLETTVATAVSCSSLHPRLVSISMVGTRAKQVVPGLLWHRGARVMAQLTGALVSLLQQAENYQATVSNPCWPTGYHKSLSLSSIYDSPCTEKERPSLPLNTFVAMAGTGNGSLCALHVSKLFNFTTCSFSRCSFDGIFQPEVSGNFIVSPSMEQGGGLAVGSAAVPWLPSVICQQSQTQSLQEQLLASTTGYTSSLW